MMMMSNYDKFKISTLQNTIKKSKNTARETNNILDLRKQKLFLKNKANLQQLSKSGQPQPEIKEMIETQNYKR